MTSLIFPFLLHHLAKKHFVTAFIVFYEKFDDCRTKSKKIIHFTGESISEQSLYMT